MPRAMKRPVRREILQQRLDALVATFDISTITPDPLELVLRYADPRDQEIAGLIAAAQAVEHYEIARYGTLIAWAEQLGMADSVSALKQTLEEEKAADKKLTEIAEASVNRKAA